MQKSKGKLSKGSITDSVIEAQYSNCTNPFNAVTRQTSNLSREKIEIESKQRL